MDVPMTLTVISKCTKSAATVNAFTVQAVSVATARLMPTVLVMKVAAAAANAHLMTAWVLLVLTTLTAEFSKDAVTERANTHIGNVMNLLVELPGIIVSSIIGSLIFICLIAACTCGRVIISGDDK